MKNDSYNTLYSNFSQSYNIISNNHCPIFFVAFVAFLVRATKLQQKTDNSNIIYEKNIR